MTEEWRDVVGYEGLYKVSNKGNVKIVDRYDVRKDRWGNNIKYHVKSKIKKTCLNNKGYCMISLTKNNKTKTFLVHRLVAQMFVDNPNNYTEVNHIDENKENNECNNLQWCDRKYNNNYGKQDKECRRVTSKWRMKKVKQFDLNGNLINTFDGIRIAEEKTNIDNRNIIKCCKNKVKTSGGYVWKYYE